MDDNCVLDFFNYRLTCSMNPETALTCTHGHFSQVVFAVSTIITLFQKSLLYIAQTSTFLQSI